MKSIRTTLLSIALFSCMAIVGQAQRSTAPSWVLGPAVRSPEVHSDKRVTFRISTPNAKEVGVNCSAFGSKEMTKGEKGVWEYTSEPPNTQ